MAKQVQTTSRDPVTSYARAVTQGKIIAGPHVREACKRHLRDLEQAPERGFFFDLDKVKRALGFYSDVLCLNGGEYEGKAYQLLQWQAFIVGSLFGWVDADGYRRFRVAFVETAKGSGKSPLAAGVGLYGLVADGEARAEIYAAATKKDQAMILFRDAVAMVDQSPELRRRLLKSGIGANAWNLAYHEKGSFFRPISADDGQSGPRPHIALLDEIHEHRNNNVVEMLRAGTKSRRQALIFMITNSGTDKRTVCWDYHDYATKVAAGQIIDDSFFGYVCALDENDNPFKDEACWHKANPSLKDGIPGIKYLREQVTQARGMPGKESIVRRLNFCQWVEAEAPWISGDVWFGCQEEYDPALLIGRRCYAGLDLSSTQDLTALALVFEPDDHDPYWRLMTYFWLPNDGLHDKADKDRVPYIAWRDAGHLETMPGRAINKLAVAKRLAEVASLYDLQKVAYDRWRIEDLKAILDQDGISLPLVPFGQGFKDMAPAVDEFERRLLNNPENLKAGPYSENDLSHEFLGLERASFLDDSGSTVEFMRENPHFRTAPGYKYSSNNALRHTGNPVMTWCAANAVVQTDPAGNRKVSKEKATGRVDGVIAAIMAVGCSMAGKTEETAIPGIIIL